ncbi:hypothetical protein [Undibacterium pigrum]|nr:hypothetical protein [Undibacterium pigrum]
MFHSNAMNIWLSNQNKTHQNKTHQNKIQPQQTARIQEINGGQAREGLPVKTISLNLTEIQKQGAGAKPAFKPAIPQSD